MHEKCRDLHARAIALIPTFFPRLFESELPVERFRELLQGAADSSFMKPHELKSIIDCGFSKMIDSVLDKRSPTKADSQRIHEALALFESMTGTKSVSNETLAQFDVLCDLEEGKIPDVVSVAGRIPVEFRKGESIIWILNEATSLTSTNDFPPRGLKLALDNIAYYSPASFKDRPVNTTGARGKSIGDLLITNRNIYHFSGSSQPFRIPVARIVSLHAYSDAVHVLWDPERGRAQTFLVNDVWFVANMLARLVGLARRQ
jgi:hypothetical protein